MEPIPDLSVSIRGEEEFACAHNGMEGVHMHTWNGGGLCAHSGICFAHVEEQSYVVCGRKETAENHPEAIRPMTERQISGLGGWLSD